MLTILENSTLVWALCQVLNCSVSRILFVSLMLAGGVRVLLSLIKKIRDFRKLPPGPWTLPIVGYLPFLGVRHKTFLDLSRAYGPLFSTRIGSKLTVVVSDYKVIRDAFRKEVFTGRPNTPLMHTLDGLGIINSEGPLWKEQRRFLHEKLREFGMSFLGNGRRKMQERIKKEVEELLEYLRQTNGAAIDPNSLLAIAVSNVICGITMSVHFEKGDVRFERLNHLIEEGMRLFGEIHYGEYIPLYNYLPGKAKAQKRVAKNREETFEFYQTLIDEHCATLDRNNPRDILDVYLIEILKAISEGRAGELFEGRDHELHLKQILGDLFSAGMETIKSSLLWTIIYMLRNPDIIKKVQDEIDSVVGRDRLPTIDDMPNLPFTEATILETLRLSNIVPLGTTHSPTKDVEIGGYRIPAGCQVVPLINGIHMDPNLWNEPNKFDPSRFIDENGKVIRPDFFLPFGVGRRMCLGDVLARVEMFLFFSGIMHQFDIQPEVEDEPPSLDSTVGATIAPKAFKAKFVPRSQPPLIPVVPDVNLRHVGSH